MEEISHILYAIAAVIASMGGLLAAWHSWRNGQQIKETGHQLQEIHLIINSRLSELLQVTKEASFAAGKLEGPVQTEVVAAAAAVVLDEAAKRAAAVLAERK